VDGRSQIFVAREVGSGLRQLTSEGGSNPSWAPTGAGIAFRAERGGVEGLYLIRPDGSGERLLAEGISFAGWSPDGR